MQVRKEPFRRHILILLVLALSLYVIVPQIGNFNDSLSKLVSANLWLAILALACFAITYLAAAATYCILSTRKLPYARTVLVQLAGMFVNRLLPAGIGALGVSYLYLTHNKHTSAEAGVLVAINNIIGFLGHAILIIIGLIFFSNQLPSLKIALPDTINVVSGLLLLVLLTVVLSFARSFRHKAYLFMQDIKSQLKSYGKRRWRLAGALTSSMTLTLSHAFTLILCLEAVGAELSLVAALLVLGVGVAAGSATPTPGGLGGMEAGLVAALVAFGLSGSLALAGVLLYRLITFWLALLAGALAFFYVQQRKILEIKL